MKTRLATVLFVWSVAFAASAHDGSHGIPAPEPRSRPAPRASAPPIRAAPPVDLTKVEGVGIVRAIDTGAGRLTISYEPIAPLNWPAGTMPFVVGKTSLLTNVTVGQKVRFRIESQQIVDLRPF